jgi:hypothetical protein
MRQNTYLRHQSCFLLLRKVTNVEISEPEVLEEVTFRNLFFFFYTYFRPTCYDTTTGMCYIISSYGRYKITSPEGSSLATSNEKKNSFPSLHVPALISNFGNFVHEPHQNKKKLMKFHLWTIWRNANVRHVYTHGSRFPWQRLREQRNKKGNI